MQKESWHPVMVITEEFSMLARLLFALFILLTGYLGLRAYVAMIVLKRHYTGIPLATDAHHLEPAITHIFAFLLAAVCLVMYYSAYIK